MDVWQITVAAVRRWYILLPLLALTAFGALRVGEGVDPEYEVTATAILVPGSAESEIESPYGNRNETTQVLSILLGATEARASIEAQGLDPDYEIMTRDRSNIVNLSVLSDSEQVSLDTGEAVLTLAAEELAQRQTQAGIPDPAQIGLEVLQPPTVSDVVVQGQLRNMVVVGILGASVSLLVAVLFDDIVGLTKRWLHRWRARRDAKSARSQPPKKKGSDSPDEGGVGPTATVEDTVKDDTDGGSTIDRASAPDFEDLEYSGRRR